MSAINDGGPAFPVRDCSQNSATGETTVHQYVYSGASLRDYFAAKAMAALLVADGTTRFDDRAREAYDVADAMLRAREKQA